jgi:hypothetical protein
MKTRIMRSWRDLCEEAQVEQDPRKFQKLAEQIARILGDQLAHLKTRQAKAGKKSLNRGKPF